MKVAIVHEWLTTWAGSESVVAELLQVFPKADLFSMVDYLPDEFRSRLGGRRATTSFIQRLPFSRRLYRPYLLALPWAASRLDLAGYDVVISSSHAFAKGLLTGPDQLHICYCHSPMRYAWDQQTQYLRSYAGWKAPLRALLAWRLNTLRSWDLQSSFNVDRFVANSAYIARRIAKCYRRRASVVYPPVDLQRFQPGTAARGDHFLTVSRLVPYKRIDLLVEAFRTLPEFKLRIVGDGPDAAALRARATPNIEFTGALDDAAVVHEMQTARAFVFAAEEDFGIAPVEAQACGTPVIALGRGGTAESIVGLDQPDPTGVHFERQTAEDLAAAIRRFAAEPPQRFRPEACSANAQRFGTLQFRSAMRTLVDNAWAARNAPLEDSLR